MKKYLLLIAFCLIYYWPIEVPVVCIGVGWWGIRKYEHRQRQAYTAMPGDGPTYSQAADTVTTGCGGSTMEFIYDSLIQDE